jgi:hypothetical protein
LFCDLTDSFFEITAGAKCAEKEAISQAFPLAENQFFVLLQRFP